MTFGTKFVDKFGEDKVCEISAANINAAIEAFLRSMKVLKDSDEVYAINIGDLSGKKPTDIISVGIKIRKDV